MFKAKQVTQEKAWCGGVSKPYLVLFLLCLLSAFPSPSPEPPSFVFKVSGCDKDVSKSPWPELESDRLPSAEAGASEEDLSGGNIAVCSSLIMVDIHKIPIPKNGVYLQRIISRFSDLNGSCRPNRCCGIKSSRFTVRVLYWTCSGRARTEKSPPSCIWLQNQHTINACLGSF